MKKEQLDLENVDQNKARKPRIVSGNTNAACVMIGDKVTRRSFFVGFFSGFEFPKHQVASISRNLLDILAKISCFFFVALAYMQQYAYMTCSYYKKIIYHVSTPCDQNPVCSILEIILPSYMGIIMSYSIIWIPIDQPVFHGMPQPCWPPHCHT